MSKITLIKTLCLLFLTAGILSVHAQTEPNENPYNIAWTSEGQLWIAGREGDPIQLEAEGSCCAVFTADASRLAYVIEDEQGARVFVRDVPYDPAAEPLIIDNFGDVILAYLRWDGLNHIWLNSVAKPSRPDAMILADELALWRLDLQGGSAELVHENAIAYPAPDGRYAILQPGVYEDESQPARLSLYDANGLQIGGFDYPAVSSGSHLSWLPEIGWTDEGLLIAIPPPDLVYTGPVKSVGFFSYNPQDGLQLLAESIFLPFPAQVLWSPDGAYAVYHDPRHGLSILTVANAEWHLTETLGEGSALLAFDSEYIIQSDSLDDRSRVILWSPENTGSYRLEDVWGIARSGADEYAILLAGGQQIDIWQPQRGLRQVLVENIVGFDTVLAGGIR